MISNRTTESLVDEILSGEYSIRCATASGPYLAYERLKSETEIFAELESREDATEVLLARLNELSKNGYQTMDAETFEDYWLILEILSQPVYQAEIEYDDVFLLPNNAMTALAETNEDFRIDYVINSLPYMIAEEQGSTLNGSPVTLLYTIYEHTDEDITDMEDRILIECGDLDKVSGYDAKYNCHSYAWYNRAFDNQYWIADISPYLNDPHYYEVTTSTAQVGDVVVYKSAQSDTAHSPIIYSISMGSLFVPTITCESKMGPAGVYRHDIRNVLESYKNNGVVEFKIYRYSESHTYTGEYGTYNSTHHTRQCEYCAAKTTLAHLYKVTSYTAAKHTYTCSLCGQTKSEAHTLNSTTGKCTACNYTGPTSIVTAQIIAPAFQ